MTAKVARWLGTTAVAAGGVSAAVWTDAAPVLVLAFVSVLLAVLWVVQVVVWVLSADGPTDRLVRVISAMRTPDSSPPPRQDGSSGAVLPHDHPAVVEDLPAAGTGSTMI